MRVRLRNRAQIRGRDILPPGIVEDWPDNQPLPATAEEIKDEPAPVDPQPELSTPEAQNLEPETLSEMAGQETVAAEDDAETLMDLTPKKTSAKGSKK